jgi:hypothetical protein
VGPPGNTGGNIDYPDEVVIGGGPGPESNELGDAMGSPALNGSAAPSDSSETFTELCEITLSAIVPSWMGSSKAPVSGFLRVKLTNQGSSSCAPQILSLSVMRSGQRLAIESPFLGVKALQIGESYTAKLPLTLRQKGTYQLKISGYSQTDYPNFSANPNGLSNPDYASSLKVILQ